MASIKITNASAVVKNLVRAVVTDENGNPTEIRQIYWDDPSGPRRLMWEANIVPVVTQMDNMLFSAGPTGTRISGNIIFRLVLNNSAGKVGYLYLPYGKWNDIVNYFDLSILTVGSSNDYSFYLFLSQVADDLGPGNIQVAGVEVNILMWGTSAITQFSLGCHVSSGGSSIINKNVNTLITNQYQSFVFPDVVYLEKNSTFNVDLIFDDPN